MNETRAVFQSSAVQHSVLFRIEVTPVGVSAKSFQQSALYFLDGDLSADDAIRLATQLLVDPVTETFSVSTVDADGREVESIASAGAVPSAAPFIEVMLLPGVTDPTAEYLVGAAHLIGVTALRRAASGQRYTVHNGTTDELERMALDTFSNPVIQRFSIQQPIAPLFVPTQAMDLTVEVIHLREADDQALLDISAERRLALDQHEMAAICAYFQREGRDPTDAELEMLAQTWSEHCVHKTFRAAIDYTGPAHGAPADAPPERQTINGLLRTYIRAATEQVAKPWVRSAFVDNAGIIAFDDRYDIAFKAETHNHPSALEPFGGANTGVGGVVRDILGVSARPIANTDVLCFGLPDTNPADLPEGVLHPRRIAAGVIHGVEDYGNKMGIPTVNGAIFYHPGYAANPLVFCGCIGLLPRDSHPTGAQPGDRIVVIGGRTGRDGLRGATFSSMEMDTTTSAIAGSSVQIGHPIHEKQVQEVVLRLRDQRLYHAITDCGAGGLSSAVGEMAAGLGAVVHLETVPLKYPGLRPWEIWLSEAQERMVLAIAPEQWDAVLAICDGQDVEAVDIGRFEASGRLRLSYDDLFVGDVSVEFLHEGIPQRHLKAEWTPAPIIVGAQRAAPLPKDGEDYGDTLLRLLAHPNVRSKEDVIRRYDHEVQGGTAVKPLVGVSDQGPSDAAVIVPQDALTPQSTLPQGEGEPVPADIVRGLAIANGINPLYGEIDPYVMAWAAVDEAVRNLVAVGTDPDQIAILDNFCWGNPSLPDRLGSLVRCAQGCYDAAVAFGVPYISGKDSLNNEYAGGDGLRHAIPGTLLISAVGIVPDVARTVTMDLKQAGNHLYLVGETRDELGGSHTNLVSGSAGGSVPQPNRNALEAYRGLHAAIRAGLAQSCHDCSEGGLAVALAEMCLAGRLGARARIDGGVPAAAGLFSESLSRLIVEVRPDDAAAFEALMTGAAVRRLGTVLSDETLVILNQDRSVLLEQPIGVLEKAWRGEIASPISANGDRVRAQHAAPLRDLSIKPRGFSVRTALPRALIVHANGTNRDHDAALALELAGAEPEIVHVNQLLSGERRLLDYQMLVVPGGFSYGDELGAGKLWAVDLRQRLRQGVERFIAEGRPVLGICNGFQALVKTGLLPGDEYAANGRRAVTLTFNESGHFECRWVYLQPNPISPCLFTEGLDEPIHCPVAHGEGRLTTVGETTLDRLWADGLVALTYTNADGSAAEYPANPNGSITSIAGLCNRAGNVLGLMPHPEDHIFSWQHPRWRRGESGLDGLRLFKNGVKYA